MLFFHILVSDLSSYVDKKELNNVTGIDTSDLTAKKDFFALKAEVEEIVVKLVNVPTVFNNLKTKVDDWDDNKLQTIPLDSKKLSDVASKKVIKIQNSKN